MTVGEARSAPASVADNQPESEERRGDTVHTSSWKPPTACAPICASKSKTSPGDWTVRFRKCFSALARQLRPPRMRSTTYSFRGSLAASVSAWRIAPMSPSRCSVDIAYGMQITRLERSYEVLDGHPARPRSLRTLHRPTSTSGRALRWAYDPHASRRARFIFVHHA